MLQNKTEIISATWDVGVKHVKRRHTFLSDYSCEASLCNGSSHWSRLFHSVILWPCWWTRPSLLFNVWTKLQFWIKCNGIKRQIPRGSLTCPQTAMSGAQKQEPPACVFFPLSLWWSCGSFLMGVSHTHWEQDMDHCVATGPSVHLWRVLCACVSVRVSEGWRCQAPLVAVLIWYSGDSAAVPAVSRKTPPSVPFMTKETPWRI